MIEQDAPPGLPVPKKSQKRKKTIWHWLIFSFLAVFVFFFLLSLLLAPFSKGPAPPFKKYVGVIEITGMILDSKTINEEIEEFLERGNIAAIVLRIDSPGGGLVASQEIFQKILKGREKKKIITSMGSVAASGGYYIAAATHTIVANPGTVTGSIGVLMKLMNIEELQRWAKLKSITLKSGKFKDIGSSTRPMTPEERNFLQNIIMEMREQFIEDIAKGRDMKIDTIRPLADGRVFTGRKAKDLGLIDEIGTLEDTIDLAGKMVGLGEKPSVLYPRKRRGGMLDRLFDKSLNLFLEKVLEMNFSHVPLQFFALPHLNKM